MEPSCGLEGQEETNADEERRVRVGSGSRRKCRRCAHCPSQVATCPGGCGPCGRAELAVDLVGRFSW